MIAQAGGALPAGAQPERWGPRDYLEVASLVLLLTVVLGCGFYVIDYRNALLDRSGTRVWQPETFIDAHIPFSPIWVWPYLVYFPLSFAPVVFAGRIRVFRRLCVSYALTYAPCLVLFAVVPSGIDRPDFEVTGPTTWALRVLYDFDPGCNVFPSLHVAGAVLVAWIYQRLAPRIAWPFWVAAAAIAASTVLVKQHYFVDVPAGVLVGTAAFFASFRGMGQRPELPGMLLRDGRAVETSKQDLPEPEGEGLAQYP